MKIWTVETELWKETCHVPIKTLFEVREDNIKMKSYDRGLYGVDCVLNQIF